MGAPASLVVGGGSVNATWTESLNGVQQGSFTDGVTTGVLNGPPAFASSNPSVATVDPVLGVVTPVAPGNTVITATDTVGNLTDTVALTVTPATTTLNNAGALSIPAQGAAPVGASSAVKKL
jgi:uncharacterized protein YjdB